MGAWSNLNLIKFFEFYLAAFFLVGTFRRVSQYQAVAGMVGSFPGRWPRLLKLVNEHRGILLTLRTILPAALALALMTIHTVASRLLWPQAGRPPYGLTLGRLSEHPLALIVVVLAGLGMAAVDVYFLIVVGRVNRPMVEGYFDQAEYWLGSWVAPVVQKVTFGRINPRAMVADEVRKALEDASHLLDTALWCTVLQTGLRIAFGLALWLTYFFSRGPAV